MQYEHGLMEAIHNAAYSYRAGPSRVPQSKLNVLILYAEHSCFTQTVLDHLLSFKLYSGFNCYYADAVLTASCNVDLEMFDAVVAHYGTGLYHATYFSPNFENALRAYSGLKIAFAQDEYDWTETLRKRIEDLGIHVLYTCVPEEHIEAIYPKKRFPHVEFVNTLTGYVPLGVDLSAPRKPIGERPIYVGYRGRPLHAKYGRLGHEKLLIGQRMRGTCEREGLRCDIAWQEQTRIYWHDWFRFLEDCRVTLGTESGSNVFDFDGSIRSAIDAELQRNPSASFEELYEKYVAPHEGRYGRMNQISPRIFEAIAMRTALVLFEGEYSGIIKPDVHFIPLRKDFSNIQQVLEKIRDDRYLTQMTERAFQDIVAPGRWSYQAFAAGFADLVSRRVRAPRGINLITSVVAAHREQTPWRVFDAVEPEKAARQFKDHIANSLAVFPVAADPVQTATSWPIFHKEHQAIALKAAEELGNQMRSLGYELLDKPASLIAMGLGVRPRGFTLLFIAILSLPYPLWRLLPLRVRRRLYRLLQPALWALGMGLRLVLRPAKTLADFRARYVDPDSVSLHGPNTIHIAYNLHLNRVGGRLVTRFYPFWAALPPWTKTMVRGPAIFAMRLFRVR